MRFRYLGDPLFLVCCACYCINRWMLKAQIESDFLRYWFNDLLLAPCAIPVVLWMFRALRLRNELGAPSLLELAWILVVWSLLFEWIGPRFISQATGDWRDVVMYWVGGIGAWYFWRKNSLHEAEFAKAAS